MKIGILILAHSNSSQLQQLVDALKADFTIFIHLDKKSSISPNLFDSEANVFVIKKHKISWGSYNIVAAELDLYKLAYSHHCDYYMLISGSDFPIKSNKEIICEIVKNRELNFISYAKLPRSDWKLNGGFDRLSLYWEELKNPQSPSFFNWMCALGRKFQKLFGLKRKLYPITFYGGELWVNLSKETVNYILNFIEQHPKYMDGFRHTRISDEIWLHTIVANSPYLEKTINDDKRYIDWKNGPEYPKILRECDYEKIMESGDFFARKFDMKSDAEIIKRIAIARMNQ